MGNIWLLVILCGLCCVWSGLNTIIIGMSIKIIYLANCVYSWLLFKCSCTSYHNNFSLLHQEVFSSCIFSLASITMANLQEYSFTRFLSIQMVRSFLCIHVKVVYVFGVHVYTFTIRSLHLCLKLLEVH